MEEEQFWSKVDIGEPEDCWDWLGCKNNKGYGQFKKQNKQMNAHRYSWILRNGEIPARLIIRHKCRGKCVNPNHLELGTTSDNNKDLIRDGVSTRGIKHPSNKLSENQVKEIRGNISKTDIELGNEYNVHPTNISRIRTGKTWKWLV